MLVKSRLSDAGLFDQLIHANKFVTALGKKRCCGIKNALLRSGHLNTNVQTSLSDAREKFSDYRMAAANPRIWASTRNGNGKSDGASSVRLCFALCTIK